MKRHSGHWFLLCLMVAASMVFFPPHPAGAAELAKEQVVRLGSDVDDIGTVDPHFATKIGEDRIYRCIYEGLLMHPPGEMNMDKIQPCIAESYSLGSDKLTWTFKLRKGIKWHEGYGDFTAEDVKFSIERVLDPKTGSPFRSSLSMVDRVTIVDPYTVQVKTKTIVPDFPAYMVDYQAGYVVCKKAVEKLGNDIKYHPIGTGPFKYQSYSPKENFTLVANEDYWGGRPILMKIIVIFMPDDSTRELALRKGEVEAISLPAKQEWIDRARKAGFDVNLTSPANTFALYFNPTKKPLDNIKVRQALCHAIDIQELVTYLGKDVAKPEVSPLPSGYRGHTEEVVRYEYNPEKAKRLLVEAGFPAGFKMSMNVSNSNIYLQPMQIIQEKWKKVGVELVLNVVDHPTYHKLIRQDLNPVVIYGAYRYPLTGTAYLTQFYHSAAIITRPTAVTNFSHYGETLPGVDKLLDDALYELNAEKQKALWVKAQQQIMQDAIAFPLLTRYYAMAKAKTLETGFEQKSWSFYDFRTMSRILRP
jgi:peptide/nickel transport system substrate-binding protein